jgi:hypothetical protein
LIVASLVFLSGSRARLSAKLTLLAAVTASWWIGFFVAVSCSNYLKLDPLPQEFAVFLGTVILPIVVWLGAWRLITNRAHARSGTQPR